MAAVEVGTVAVEADGSGCQWVPEAAVKAEAAAVVVVRAEVALGAVGQGAVGPAEEAMELVVDVLEASAAARGGQ